MGWAAGPSRWAGPADPDTGRMADDAHSITWSVIGGRRSRRGHAPRRAGAAVRGVRGRAGVRLPGHRRARPGRRHASRHRPGRGDRGVRAGAGTRRRAPDAADRPGDRGAGSTRTAAGRRADGPGAGRSARSTGPGAPSSSARRRTSRASTGASGSSPSGRRTTRTGSCTSGCAGPEPRPGRAYPCRVPLLLAPRYWGAHLLMVVALAAAIALGIWQYHAWAGRPRGRGARPLQRAAAAAGEGDERRRHVPGGVPRPAGDLRRGVAAGGHALRRGPRPRRTARLLGDDTGARRGQRDARRTRVVGAAARPPRRAARSRCEGWLQASEGSGAPDDDPRGRRDPRDADRQRRASTWTPTSTAAYVVVAGPPELTGPGAGDARVGAEGLHRRRTCATCSTPSSGGSSAGSRSTSGSAGAATRSRRAPNRPRRSPDESARISWRRAQPLHRLPGARDDRRRPAHGPRLRGVPLKYLADGGHLAPGHR